jgi:hypothetical protein
VLDLIKNFSLKGKYPGKLFWLPGVATYTPPLRTTHSRTPQLPFDLKDVPAWALPGVMTRPVWGSE